MLSRPSAASDPFNKGLRTVSLKNGHHLMRLYIHIGTHKTGTTSIQAFLRKQADILGAAGIYVPTAGVLDEQSGHHNIGWGLRGEPRFDPVHGTLQDLIAELGQSSADAAVISSEDFEYLVDNPAALLCLEQALAEAGHEPYYILFTRRADTYAVSLYGELRQHHGLTARFRDFTAEILRNGKFVMHHDWTFYLDIDAFARNWRRTARGPLHICSYDAAVDGKGLLPTFLSLIGAPDQVGQIGQNAEILNIRRSADIGRMDRIIAGWRLRYRFRPKGVLAEQMP
jgi:hypothetical protein